jgi:hypothetical protein
MVSSESVDLGSAICRFFRYHKSVFRATIILEGAITSANHSLVVSEVCARGYGAGRARKESTKGRKELWADPQPVPELLQVE